MRFTLVFLSFFMCSFAYGQIEECPCDPIAIECPCPIPPEYDPPIPPTPPPSPIPHCGDIDYTDITLDSDEFMSGFEDGREQTNDFIRLSLAMCEYSFAGGSAGAILGGLYMVPNPDRVITPSSPQMMSPPGIGAPYVQEGSEILIASGGHDPNCVSSLGNDLIEISEIIADKIDQEIRSPGSTGFSLSYWLGFCNGFGISAGSW